MAIKFRLRGLAETLVDHIKCPFCRVESSDESFFSTEPTKVTFEGIIVVVQCKQCGEVFVPDSQRCGIIDAHQLRLAVEKDARESGEPILENLNAVRLTTEKLNAHRRGSLH
jgi:uncharacterized Zn finger protein